LVAPRLAGQHHIMYMHMLGAIALLPLSHAASSRRRENKSGRTDHARACVRAFVWKWGQGRLLGAASVALHKHSQLPQVSQPPGLALSVQDSFSGSVARSLLVGRGGSAAPPQLSAALLPCRLIVNLIASVAGCERR